MQLIRGEGVSGRNEHAEPRPGQRGKHRRHTGGRGLHSTCPLWGAGNGVSPAEMCGETGADFPWGALLLDEHRTRTCGWMEPSPPPRNLCRARKGSTVCFLGLFPTRFPFQANLGQPDADAWKRGLQPEGSVRAAEAAPSPGAPRAGAVLAGRSSNLPEGAAWLRTVGEQSR